MERTDLRKLFDKIKAETPNFGSKTDPNYPVKCANEYCQWKGVLCECGTDLEQDGWENPSYEVPTCPECGEVVEF